MKIKVWHIQQTFYHEKFIERLDNALEQIQDFEQFGTTEIVDIKISESCGDKCHWSALITYKCFNKE